MEIVSKGFKGRCDWRWGWRINEQLEKKSFDSLLLPSLSYCSFLKQNTKLYQVGFYGSGQLKKEKVSYQGNVGISPRRQGWMNNKIYG